MLNPKFTAIIANQTAAPNYDLMTADILEKLEQWDQTYGISMSDVEDDCFTVTFHSLPPDLSQLADEIYDFCPDVVDQHFGCMDDIDQKNLPADLRAICSDVDFSDPNFGVLLLQKFLKLHQAIGLWWD